MSDFKWGLVSFTSIVGVLLGFGLIAWAIQSIDKRIESQNSVSVGQRCIDTCKPFAVHSIRHDSWQGYVCECSVTKAP